MWVARDKNNDNLHLFVNKPVRHYNEEYDIEHWMDFSVDDNPEVMWLNDKDIDSPFYNYFKDLKWEDEPISVNLIRSDEYELYQSKRELEDLSLIENIEKVNYKTIS